MMLSFEQLAPSLDMCVAALNKKFHFGNSTANQKKYFALAGRDLKLDLSSERNSPKVSLDILLFHRNLTMCL